MPKHAEFRHRSYMSGATPRRGSGAQAGWDRQRSRSGTERSDDLRHNVRSI